MFLSSVILPTFGFYSKRSTLICPILLSKQKILVHAQEKLLIWFCAKISAAGRTNFSWRLSQKKYISYFSQGRNVRLFCSLCESVCAWTYSCTHSPALPPAGLWTASPSSLRLQWTYLSIWWDINPNWYCSKESSLFLFHISPQCGPQARAVGTACGSSENDLCVSVLTFILISARKIIFPTIFHL